MMIHAGVRLSKFSNRAVFAAQRPAVLSIEHRPDTTCSIAAGR